MDAYQLLCDWPVSQRDSAHSVAMKACAAALRGEIEAETVRGLFAAFAQRHDLLIKDAAVNLASRLRRNQNPYVR
jgi:hypothetical protein